MLRMAYVSCTASMRFAPTVARNDSLSGQAGQARTEGNSGDTGIPGTSMSKPLSRRSRDFFAGIPHIYSASSGAYETAIAAKARRPLRARHAGSAHGAGRSRRQWCPSIRTPGLLRWTWEFRGHLTNFGPNWVSCPRSAKIGFPPNSPARRPRARGVSRRQCPKACCPSLLRRRARQSPRWYPQSVKRLGSGRRACPFGGAQGSERSRTGRTGSVPVPLRLLDRWFMIDDFLCVPRRPLRSSPSLRRVGAPKRGSLRLGTLRCAHHLPSRLSLVNWWA